jgi:PPE-repeat protein
VSTTGTQSQLNQLVSTLPGAMQGLATPGATSAGILSSPDGLLNDIIASGSNIGIYNDGVALLAAGTNAAAWNGFQAIVTGVTSSAPAAAASAASTAPAALGAGLAGSVAPAASPIAATMGQATPVGRMSVPATWSTAAPEPTTEPVTAADWTADTDEGSVTNVATGMPATATSGRGGYGIATPRYGIKPTVMPTRVLV